MKVGNLDSLLQNLRHLFQQEYDRGARDALRRVMNSISGGRRRTPAKAKSRSSKLRAPHGTARKLIQRVLSQQKTGVNVPKIVAAAKSPAEKRVSVAAIRFELYKGKKERRYRNTKGRWSLPASQPAKGK